MATDYAEKEREFLSELKAGTGRDLAQWMAAISSQGFRNKNEVIDWLRGQGFMFWKASWLERVHHNGGRPIYADPVTASANAEIARHLLEPDAARDEPSPPAPLPAARPQAAARPPPVVPAANVGPQTVPAVPADGAVEALLAKAKGYRPLAEHLLRAVRAALPSSRAEARGGLVVLSEGGEFAVLLPGPRELRLGLALGERPATALLPRGKIAGAGDVMTHVVVLTDARQVSSELLAAVRDAHATRKR